MNDEEFLEQPSDNDEAGKFYNSEEDKSQTKEKVLQAEVLKLFNLSDSITKILQQAIEDKNPILLDYKNLWHKGMDFDSDARSDVLTDLKKGEIDLTCWLERCEDNQGYIRQDEPVIILEKDPVISISLTNLRFSLDIQHDYADRFNDKNTYRLGLQAQYSVDGEDVDGEDVDGEDNEKENESLFYDFYISNKGDWLKERFTSSASTVDQKSSELTLHDIGIAKTALQILKSRLNGILSTPEDN